MQAPIRLKPGLAPRNFQEYQLAKDLAREPERAEGLPPEPTEDAQDHSHGGECAADAQLRCGGSGHGSVRNSMLAATASDGQRRLVAVGAAGVFAVPPEGGGFGLAAAQRLGGADHEAALDGGVDSAAVCGCGAKSCGAAAISASGEVLFWRGDRLEFLDSKGSAWYVGAYEEGETKLGIPIGVSPTLDGSMRALFCRTAQTPGSPLPVYILTLLELSLHSAEHAGTSGSAGSPLPSLSTTDPLVRLVGHSPPLHVAMQRGCCLVLANGPFRENGYGGTDYEVETALRGAVDDEMDEELRQMLIGRGMREVPSRPPQAAAGPLGIVTELCVSKASTRVTITRLGRPAICGIPVAADASSGRVVLDVVLRTPEGHGAIVRCSKRAEDTAIEMEHIATFPGLGMLCDTPGFAYAVLSPAHSFAAVARWRGASAIELYEHPAGSASARTQQLYLPEGAALRGAQLTEEALFVLHSKGLDRYLLNRAGDQGPGLVEWGEAPAAPTPSDGAWLATPTPSRSVAGRA